MNLETEKTEKEEEEDWAGDDILGKGCILEGL